MRHTHLLQIQRRYLAAALVGGLVALMTDGAAHAAGSGMPWEAPLQRILESIEGPVAKVIAVVIIIVTGLSRRHRPFWPRSPCSGSPSSFPVLPQD